MQGSKTNGACGWQAAAVALAALTLGGCRPDRDAVVVYAALDAEFSAPILAEFARQSGLEVRPKYDVESTKTVGLAEALIAERSRPRCDLFWNNEILHTLRLERLGLLQVYRPRRADEYPADVRSPAGTWHGFAARARILLINTELVGPNDEPRSVLELADERWRGRVGLAKPLFGTTATHAAALFATWGPEPARQFFAGAKPIVQIMSGNKHVAQAVGSGQLAWGLTDTDDALAEIDAGRPVKIVYPDQDDGQLGTLFIPNTLAILKGAPHAAAARRLADYLLTPEVEAQLSAGPSGQIPLHPAARSSGRVATPQSVRAMSVPWSRAGEMWEETAAFLRDQFSGE